MMIDVRRKGVTGVPFVVIDNKWAVSGGQSADTYEQVRVYSELPCLATFPHTHTHTPQIFTKIANTQSDKPVSPPQVPAAPTCPVGEQ